MRRGRLFFVRLLTAALIIILPFLALNANTLYFSHEAAKASAFTALRAESHRAAKEVTRELDVAERMLTFVAVNESVRSLSGPRCTRLLQGIDALEPMHDAVSVMSLEGRVICTSFQPVGDTRTVPTESAWFKLALASDGFTLSEPYVGHFSHRPVVMLSRSVFDESGHASALVMLSIDLQQLEAAMVGEGLPQGIVFSLFNKDAKFLVRSPNTSLWLGKGLPDRLQPLRKRLQSEEITAVGADGVERVYASTALSKYGLRVVAGIPTDVILAGPNAEIRRGVAVSAAALVLATLVAFIGAHALSRPVRSLSRAARAFAEGHTDRRADESLPGEFRELAVEMNSMLTARYESERIANRLAKFYEAVSRTNQAIVRAVSPGELYSTICKVCVETGQASMSWIGVVDGVKLTPVAWGGEGKAYTEQFDLNLLSAPMGAALGASVMEGEIRVANDYLSDTRTLPFRDYAQKFGVRASAILPFTMGGKVVGTLNLYAKQTDFFDEPVIRLLKEMTGDISFALDNFERAAEYQRLLLEIVVSEGKLTPTGLRDVQMSKLAAAVSDTANRAKNQFLAKMSHELRTPLNAVLGFSQLLQEGAKDKLNSKERKQLDLIFLAGAQLRALVDDVLDFSVIESGKLNLALSEFDILGLLDGVMRMSEAAARSGSIKLVAAYEGSDLRLHTDPVRLRQVMLNLVSNAIKYTEAGGTVTVGVEEQHGRIVIEVADTGLGMSEQQLSGLFQPFNRLGREESGIQGTGIGMVLVRQLVELMGGSVSVASEVKAGTTVRVELPRAKIADPLLDWVSTATLPKVLKEFPGSATSAPSGLVLYIEDNPVNVLLVEQMLRPWTEVQFVVAEDGESGLRLAVELRPDVILLDMQLPDMTGQEVLRQLKRDASTAGISVVALSASAMPNEVTTAKEAGATDYWAKPVDVAAFREGMRRLLGARPDAQRSPDLR